MIEGHYCSFSFIDEPKTNQSIVQCRQIYIGSNNVNANNREQIAYDICNHPIIDNNKIIGTEDVLRQWVLDKDFAIRIAKCFLAGKENTENPLYKDLKEQLIDNVTHDLIWLKADYLSSIWSMLSIKWDEIIKAIIVIWKDFPFKTPLELMKQIIYDEYTYPFVNWTGSKYKERSKTHNKKMWALMRKLQRMETLNDKENKKLNHLIKEHRNIDSWMHRVLNVCGFLGDNGDNFLETRVKIHNELCDGIARINLKCECDPKLAKYRTTTHSWQNGHMIMLNKT